MCYPQGKCASGVGNARPGIQLGIAGVQINNQLPGGMHTLQILGVAAPLPRLNAISGPWGARAAWVWWVATQGARRPAPTITPRICECYRLVGVVKRNARGHKLPG